MLLPAILVANIGVPMLLLLWPVLWLAWLPLTLLQAELGYRGLQLPRAVALKTVGVAKLTATLIGVPLVWLVMLALQLAVSALVSVTGAGDSSVVAAATLPLRSAWLAPTEDAWRVYLAFAVLAVPCSLVTLMTERAIARRMLASLEPHGVRSWINRANVLSYVLLVITAASYPVATGGRAW
jgi:hypothetical protein